MNGPNGMGCFLPARRLARSAAANTPPSRKPAKPPASSRRQLNQASSVPRLAASLTSPRLIPDGLMTISSR